MFKKIAAEILGLALAAGVCFSPVAETTVLGADFTAESGMVDPAWEILQEDGEMDSQLAAEGREEYASDWTGGAESRKEYADVTTEFTESRQAEGDEMASHMPDFGEEAFSSGAEAECADPFSDEGEIGEELFSDEMAGDVSVTPAGATETVLQINEGDDITGPLNALLLKLRDKATDTTPCKIVIPPGNYRLTGTICMYSNMHLYAQGAVITKTSDTKHILLRFGNTETSAGGYNGYRNVTIEGGTWDLNYESVADKEGDGGFGGFRLGHATNVTVKNVTFLNNLKSHFLELAGVKNVSVTGCTFRGYWEEYEEGGQECIQLDACMDYIFPGYLPFDGTTCENVRIEENTFEDVFAGVGSHSMMFNRTYKNIVITGNRFTNVKKRAVWCLNYRDSRVENNIMENVGGGVYARSMYSSNTHLIPGSKPNNTQNQQPENLVIANNRISLAYSDYITGVYWRTFGIQVLGEMVKNCPEGVPDGTYIIKGVTVKGNTVEGPGNGIRLGLAKDCTVSGNQVILTNPGNFTNLGIYAGASRNCRIEKNTVKDARNTGIYVYKGSDSYKIPGADNIVSYNNVSGCYGNGIYAAERSDNTTITRNTCTKNKGMGIYAAGVKGGDIAWNTVSGNSKDGISVRDGKNVFVRRNTVSGNKGSGIVLYRNKGTKTAYNEVTGSRKMGIWAYGGNEAVSIYRNTCSGGKGTGIYVKDSGLKFLNNNKVENNRGNGISVYSSVLDSQKGNSFRENTSSYAIYAKSSNGIKSLKKPQLSEVTNKTRILTGKAAGAKSVTAYEQKKSGNVKLGTARLSKNGSYDISIRRKKKGTTLVIIFKDGYGNKMTAQCRVK